MAELWEYEGNILQPKFDRSLRVKKLLLKYSAEYLVNPDFATLPSNSLITKQHLLDYSGGGGGIVSIQAGSNISVDNTDPAKPIVNFVLGLNQNFVTDAEKTVIGNTSGTNSGDQVGDGVTITGTGTVGDPFVAHIPIVTSSNKLYIFNNLGRNI